VAGLSEPKVALVTGISGFTGRYLRAELESRGYRVVGLAHHPSGHADDHVIDLCDAESIRAFVHELAPDVVLHLGAITFVPHADAFEIYRVNLFGTLNLLDALVTSPKRPTRVLLASTANVYGTPTIELVPESYPPAPVNHYATSKLAMEHMSRTYSDRLPIVITRPFNYTGVGQSGKFLVPKIVAHFRERKPVIELGNLDIERDFSDVRDVARIYAALVESEAAIGKTLNIASGRSTSLRAIVAMIEGLAGYRIEVRVNAAFVRATDIATLAGDVSALEDVVGRAKRIGIEETLGWMLEERTT